MLEARLEIWGDNEAGDVQRELDSARGGGDSSEDSDKPGKGKAKGHFKDDED